MSTGKTIYPVNDSWRELVRREMKTRGMSLRTLASAAGVSAPVLSDLLKGKNNGSHAVAAIHRVLGWPPPAIGLNKQASARAHALYIVEQLPEEDFKIAEATLIALWSKRNEKPEAKR